MKTLTLKIDEATEARLRGAAKGRRGGKSALAREFIEEGLNGHKKQSCHDLASHLCGIGKSGKPDLSRNKRKYLKGFGR